MFLSCMFGTKEGRRKEKSGIYGIFFFVWVANKREIKRKMFTFLENTKRCL